jgi:hypothetical protein
MSSPEPGTDPGGGIDRCKYDLLSENSRSGQDHSETGRVRCRRHLDVPTPALPVHTAPKLSHAESTTGSSRATFYYVMSFDEAR